MASQTKITITHDKESTADLVFQLLTTKYTWVSHIHGLMNLLNKINGGHANATVATVVDDGNAAQATGTVTFSAPASASDTFLINGVTFTAIASGATGNQFNVGANATVQAANLASAINGSVSALITGVVTATSALGVVTIKAVHLGPTANAITIAKGVDAGTVMTVSGARLTGGSSATNSSSATYSLGV